MIGRANIFRSVDRESAGSRSGRGGISRSLAAVLFGLLALQCAGGFESLPAPADPGAQVWVARCGSCHNRPHPRRHTFEQWQPLLARMQFRMKQRRQSPLTSDERSAILAYLRKYAR